MSKITQKGLERHVDSTLQNERERMPGGMLRDPPGCLRTLNRRIASVTDLGLSDVVFWHGKWWNYAQAVAMRDYLRALIAESYECAA